MTNTDRINYCKEKTTNAWKKTPILFTDHFPCFVLTVALQKKEMPSRKIFSLLVKLETRRSCWILTFWKGYRVSDRSAQNRDRFNKEDFFTNAVLPQICMKMERFESILFPNRRVQRFADFDLWRTKPETFISAQIPAVTMPTEPHASDSSTQTMEGLWECLQQSFTHIIRLQNLINPAGVVFFVVLLHCLWKPVSVNKKGECFKSPKNVQLTIRSHETWCNVSVWYFEMIAESCFYLSELAFLGKKTMAESLFFRSFFHALLFSEQSWPN